MKAKIFKLLNIFYWSLITILCFWILSAVISIYLDIEFTNESWKSYYELYGFSGIIIIIISSTIRSSKKSDSDIMTAFKIILVTLLPIGLGYLCMLIGFVTCVCTSTYSTYFVNKENNSIKIVSRSTGCGALDSGPPANAILKVRELTSYLRWIQDFVDTNTIDKREWIRQ